MPDMRTDPGSARPVTHCDRCGEELDDGPVCEIPFLSEFLGIGFCPDCRPSTPADVAVALLDSGVLSLIGQILVEGVLKRQAPAEVRRLHHVIDRRPGAWDGYFEGRAN